MKELQIENIINYYLAEAGSNFKALEVFNFEINGSEGIWDTNFSQVVLYSTDKNHENYDEEIIKFDKDIKDLSVFDLRNAVKELCA